MTVISIDGNIGAGKSTVLNYLKKTYKYNIDVEPVDDWIPFLQDMYKNNKDAFEFQIKVWMDRVFNTNYTVKDITITERSAFFQWHVFSKANFENGKLKERQYTILKNLYEKCHVIPDMQFYIRTEPQKSYDRIHKRSRNCESEIPLDYIETLHHLHENAYEMLLENNTPNVYLIEMEGKTVQQIGDEIYQTIASLIDV